MNPLKLYNNFSKWPGGKFLFSFITSQTAPYFFSIRPFVSELTASHCVIKFKKRRRVTNHLGTVHAIAMCNACELAFGLTMEAGITKNLRWIPKGMTVRYLKKAQTDLIATCHYPQVSTLTLGDYSVPVKVTDSGGQLVMEADIIVYISEKPIKT